MNDLESITFSDSHLKITELQRVAIERKTAYRQGLPVSRQSRKRRHYGIGKYRHPALLLATPPPGSPGGFFSPSLYEHLLGQERAEEGTRVGLKLSSRNKHLCRTYLDILGLILSTPQTPKRGLLVDPTRQLLGHWPARWPECLLLELARPSGETPGQITQDWRSAAAQRQGLRLRGTG